ncbi:MAG TPA: hypothetical protein DF296_06400 [Candidatus Margulisbacteria bacterium]|nr:hypothetical protein [Candidatus Margulisiibacteriota bacterium]
MTVLSVTRQSNLQDISPKRNILADFAESYTTPRNSNACLYISNAFYVKAKDIAMLYKKCWQVELYFKWIKQHLYIKSFWGNSENAVRIQIFCALSAYCFVAIVEHECRLNRSMFDVLRILRGSLIDRTPIRQLLERSVDEGAETCIDTTFQLSFNF